MLSKNAPKLSKPFAFFESTEEGPLLAERIDNCSAHGIIVPSEEAKVVIILNFNGSCYMMTDEEAAQIAMTLAEMVAKGRKDAGI